MLKIRIQLFFILFLLTFGLAAQPEFVGTDIFNGSFSAYTLVQKGKLRQYRGQSISSAGSGVRKWYFGKGSPSSPSPKWNPYTGTPILSSFNTIIDPAVDTASARLNGATWSGNQGVDGYFPAITSGRYYTINIGDNSASDNYMAVWETNFNPVTFTGTTQTPGTVCANGDSISILVTTSSSPNALENIYVRYSRSLNFDTSYLLKLTFSGSVGSAKIPVTNTWDTIRYYIFSSLLSTSSLAPGGVVSQTNCDLSTLNMDNNSNLNYKFSVQNAPIPSTNFSVPTLCAGSTVVFPNTGTISSGSIVQNTWDFGNGTTSTSTNGSATYSSSGVYQVTLISRSNNGCEKTKTQSITVNPKPVTATLIPY